MTDTIEEKTMDLRWEYREPCCAGLTGNMVLQQKVKIWDWDEEAKMYVDKPREVWRNI